MIASMGVALASGALVGFVLSLTGGGGSILATPLLLYVVCVGEPHVAIGTGALAVSVNAFANFAGHARSGNVRWLWASLFAVIGLLAHRQGRRWANWSTASACSSFSVSPCSRSRAPFFGRRR